MENQQANHRKIKVVIGILAVVLATVLLYWLFTSLISMNQHNQTNQGPSHDTTSQADDENSKRQRPNSDSEPSSNPDGKNETSQTKTDESTNSSPSDSTKTAGNGVSVVRNHNTYHYRQIASPGRPSIHNAANHKPANTPSTKPDNNKPTTPPNPSKPPKPTPEPAQAAVKIVGAAEVGSTLIAQIDDPDGLKDGGIRYYQWFADGAAIPGASYFSYKLTPAEAGKKITVKTTHANNKNVMKDLISSATIAVGNAASNNNHGSVTIDGINRVGQVFTAHIIDADGVPESGITYRWYEFYGKFLGTGKTLAQTKDHLGMQVIVQASYTDKKGHKESVTSGFSGSVVDNSSGGTGAGIISPISTAPKITLHGPASVKEGETAVYTATLDKATNTDVSADIKITHNTSNPNNLNVRWDSQRVVIKAGETSAKFYIDTNADTGGKGKTYTVSLSNAVAGMVNKTNTSTYTAVNAQSIFMLSYVYPLAEAGGSEFSDYWKAIHAAGSSKIPYTLIMADGGPDAKLDPGYVRLLKKNAELGFKTVAYIRTIHQTRPIAEVKAAMAKFIELYGADKIHGFYFDEISSRNNGATAYMAELYNYTKSTYGNKLVVANPGTHITDAIAPYADIFMTNEGTADEYINNYKTAYSAFEKDPANSHRIFHTIYAAKASDYQKIINLSRQRNAGWVFITTDSTTPDGRPYNDLAKNFPSLVDSVNNLGRQPLDPNRATEQPLLSGAIISGSSVTTTILSQ